MGRDDAEARVLVDLFFEFFYSPVRCYRHTAGRNLIERFSGSLFSRDEEIDQGLVAVDQFRVGLIWFIDRP